MNLLEMYKELTEKEKKEFIELISKEIREKEKVILTTTFSEQVQNSQQATGDKPLFVK